MSGGQLNDATAVLRPHKNSSQRQTFEMLGAGAECVKKSITHDTYRPRTVAAEKPLDDREKKRKELEEHLWKTITDQVLSDFAKKTKSFYTRNNQFETTYSSAFQIEGFKPKEIGEQLDEELCARFPLYSTNGVSLPVNLYECNKAKQSIHKPLTHLFKKDSRFTSRLRNPNGCHAPVAQGHFAFV